MVSSAEILLAHEQLCTAPQIGWNTPGAWWRLLPLVLHHQEIDSVALLGKNHHPGFSGLATSQFFYGKTDRVVQKRFKVPASRLPITFLQAFEIVCIGTMKVIHIPVLYDGNSPLLAPLLHLEWTDCVENLYSFKRCGRIEECGRNISPIMNFADKNLDKCLCIDVGEWSIIFNKHIIKHIYHTPTCLAEELRPKTVLMIGPIGWAPCSLRVQPREIQIWKKSCASRSSWQHFQNSAEFWRALSRFRHQLAQNVRCWDCMDQKLPWTQQIRAMSWNECPSFD